MGKSGLVRWPREPEASARSVKGEEGAEAEAEAEADGRVRVRRVRLGMIRIEGESLKSTPSSVVTIIAIVAYWVCSYELFFSFN